MVTKDLDSDDRDKRGKIPLIQVFGEEDAIEGKFEPERMIAIESSLAGTGPEASRQLCLSNRQMKKTAVDGCLLADGSSNLEGTISLEAVIGIKPGNQTFPIVSSRKIDPLPMSWQKGEVVERDNEKNKQFDPSG